MIYIDHKFKCHTTNPNNTLKEVNTNFFNDKCNTFIEGYRTRNDDTVFNDGMISSFKSYDELYTAQHKLLPNQILCF